MVAGRPAGGSWLALCCWLSRVAGGFRVAGHPVVVVGLVVVHLVVVVCGLVVVEIGVVFIHHWAHSPLNIPSFHVLSFCIDLALAGKGDDVKIVFPNISDNASLVK